MAFVNELLRPSLLGMLTTDPMQPPHPLPATLPTLPAALPCSMEILTIVVPQWFLIMGSIANMIKGEGLTAVLPEDVHRLRAMQHACSTWAAQSCPSILLLPRAHVHLAA